VALVVGANLPDIDALAYLIGPTTDLEWRRGWTHGILAVLVLPFLLAGALLLLYRLSGRRRSRDGCRAVHPRELLLLSSIAVLSHPVLDTLNTYGVRWLMPFSGTWYYGDTLFIVDPWVWATLALGVFYCWRRRKAQKPAPGRPAVVALGVTTVYALLMAGSGVAARSIIRRDVESGTGNQVKNLMAGPVAVDPLVRRFVVEQEEEYQVGRFSWHARPQVDAATQRFRKGPVSHPAVLAAAKTPMGRRFLSWARFPTFTIEVRRPGHYLVHLVDLRYAERPGERFGAVSIPVTLP
jgi:inner membrane protein